jgi:hypothetical protein
MPFQFVDLVLAACAALGQILGGADIGTAPRPLAVHCDTEQQPLHSNLRIDELLNQYQEMKQMRAEWRKFWMNGQPSQMPYQRVDGGIGP